MGLFNDRRLVLFIFYNYPGEVCKVRYYLFNKAYYWGCGCPLFIKCWSNCHIFSIVQNESSSINFQSFVILVKLSVLLFKRDDLMNWKVPRWPLNKRRNKFFEKLSQFLKWLDNFRPGVTAHTTTMIILDGQVQRLVGGFCQILCVLWPLPFWKSVSKFQRTIFYAQLFYTCINFLNRVLQLSL